MLPGCAHSDASGQLFRQHPVSHSGPSGHLRIVAAQAWFLMSGQAPFVNVFGEPGRAPHGMAVEFEAICIVDQAIEDARPQVKFF